MLTERRPVLFKVDPTLSSDVHILLPATGNEIARAIVIAVFPAEGLAWST